MFTLDNGAHGGKTHNKGQDKLFSEDNLKFEIIPV